MTHQMMLHSYSTGQTHTRYGDYCVLPGDGLFPDWWTNMVFDSFIACDGHTTRYVVAHEMPEKARHSAREPRACFSWVELPVEYV